MCWNRIYLFAKVPDFRENKDMLTLTDEPGRLLLFATLPRIALLALSVSIELVSSSARVTPVKSAKVCKGSLKKMGKVWILSQPADPPPPPQKLGHLKVNFFMLIFAF